MAVTHFVQSCDGAVFVGSGSGALLCGCGQVLIEGYEPARFLAVGIQCGRCGVVTETPGLPVGASPPFAVVVAEPVADVRVATVTLPPSAFVVGRAEMERITALYLPATPGSNVYAVTAEMLDSIEASYAHHAGSALVAVEGFPATLGGAVAYLRGRMVAGDWGCLDSAASAAACLVVCGFQLFLATWGHHPLFPAMVASAGESGFSTHGLAPFAAAHVLTVQKNRIGFHAEAGRIAGFSLATGPVEAVSVVCQVFDRFEYPHGLTWNAAALRVAVAERMAGAQGRINLRHPGVLLLSPGVALAGFDEALIRGVREAVASVGRKNRGLMAVAPIVLRLLPAGSDRRAVQFGYGLFPVRNPHYRGETMLG